MNIKHILWIVALGLVGWIGCSDDETLIPSDTLVPQIELPQGNHEYDTKIVDFFEHTGLYILYKFEPRDVYFAGNLTWSEMYYDTIVIAYTFPLGDNLYVKDSVVYQTMLGRVQKSWPLGTAYKDNGLWTRATLDEENKTVYIEEQNVKAYGNFKVDEADEEYVGEQLAWIEEMFLNFYPELVLKKAMPMKIILGRNLKEMFGGTALDRSYYTDAYNSLIFSHGDESIENLTQHRKDSLKSILHTWFGVKKLASIYSFSDFYEVTNYYWAGTASKPLPKDYYRLGLVGEPKTVLLDQIQKGDLESYLKMITSNSYATLTAEPENGDYDKNSYLGILHPKKDVNQLIRKKYDILIRIFKDLGIDLQAIGELYN